MRTLQEECTRKKKHLREPSEIHTTLYELIETVIDVVGTDNNHMIMPVLMDMLRKGKAKFILSGTLSN